MAMTNYERVGKALELLRAGLGPFVEREVQHALKRGALSPDALRRFIEDPLLAQKDIAGWDVAALLRLMWETWNEVFRRTLGNTDRSLVSELREWRKRWAHQEPFSSDDAYRVLDSAARLLAAVSAQQAAEVERMKMELLQVRFDEQIRGEKRKLGGSLIEVAASGGLKPWREVITPHPDVTSGEYQRAEFAADLWQVYLGEGSDEYRDPVEFFRRTYLTESLKWLLINAVKRLSGLGGDPVVQLQTNFGGGKTHSMLALYHLFSGLPPAELPGVDEALKEAGLTAVPTGVRCVVLVGNRISPGNPSVKKDGTMVRTLWGELAWQLDGRKAYERVRADDERATSPGDVLRQLFNEYGPCLILIDEWVAYARQLHDDPDLPGGSFDAQFTFAQVLTEAVKASPRCLLVVSLPASESPSLTHTGAEDVEVGGIRGREALARLRNVIGRVEAPWRPATAEESFEIVRRRLFQPMTDPEQFKARDVVARAFAELYRTQRGEFPAECRESEYERRIKAAYPIHPEVFDRLYGDWSTLITFQRTRGVLRLMAAVIHSLWQQGDRSPLILPSTIPMDDLRVQSELTRYLPDNWTPVIQKDVDGQGSLPVRLDGEPNLGRYSACRRVARTIFLGSAPTYTAANRGLEDRRVKLGCVMPGESPAVFGDALRRLSAQATYLYSDGVHYWYAPQPNVTSLAADRAEQLRRQPELVAEEIERRVKEEVRRYPGEFSRVHPFPRSNQDVPDEPDARLVVLGLDVPHSRNGGSPALAAARQILEWRGNQPRIYRNALVFLAADAARLQDLDEAVRHYLAWKSILRDREALNLDPHQVRTAERQMESAEATVRARIPETFQWLLVPIQRTPQDQVEWQFIRLQGSDPLAVRASKKLIGDALLYPQLGGTVLRMELDKVPLWRGDHVEIRQLIEDFARYVYLPRLKDPSVLVRAIRDGIALLTWEQDTFAYAESFDEQAKRYRGLGVAQDIVLTESAPVGLLVKPEVARRQLDVEAAEPSPAGASIVNPTRQPGRTEGTDTLTTSAPPPKPVMKRFYAVKELDPTRAGLEASQIAKEVIAHLVGLPSAEVRVTLEIQATLPDGAPDHLVRILSENCRTLKFMNHGFEHE